MNCDNDVLLKAEQSGNEWEFRKSNCLGGEAEGFQVAPKLELGEWAGEDNRDLMTSVADCR